MDDDPAPEDSELSDDTGRNGEDPSDNSEVVDESAPVAVGDKREKHVTLHTRAGDAHDHGEVYLKQSSVAFFVSTDASFPDKATTRYPKADLCRVEVTQHHAACFITTATVGEGPALDALREFRDGSLLRSSSGRALVALYDAVSPPIAATLSRHPDATTARFVRRLVGWCGRLARRRERATPPLRAAFTLLLVALYVLGVSCAALGHLAIRVRECAVR